MPPMPTKCTCRVLPSKKLVVLRSAFSVLRSPFCVLRSGTENGERRTENVLSPNQLQRLIHDHLRRVGTRERSRRGGDARAPLAIAHERENPIRKRPPGQL